MAGTRSPGLGHLERSVMDVLWAQAGPVTARAVHGFLERSDALAYATVKTVLDRLARKDWSSASPTRTAGPCGIARRRPGMPTSPN